MKTEMEILHEKKQRWQRENAARAELAQKYFNLQKALLTMPTFSDDQSVKRWQSGLKAAKSTSVDENGNLVLGAREKSLRYVEHAVRLNSDATLGAQYLQKNLQVQKLIQAGVVKGVSELLTHPEMFQLLQFNMVMAAPSDMDMQWMLLFTPADLRNAMTGKVVDQFGSAEFDELGETERIKYVNIGYDQAQEIRRRRFGKGFQFTTEMLANNPTVNLNTAISWLRIAAMKKQTNIAYNELTTKFNGTQAWGATGNEVEKTIDALNAAGHTLKERFATSDKKHMEVTPDTPIYIVGHPRNFDLVDRALSATPAAQIGGTNKILKHNFVVLESYKVPQQLGGNNAVQLWLPGGRNFNATFKDMETADEVSFDTNTTKVGAQEVKNVVVMDPDQSTRVNLA